MRKFAMQVGRAVLALALVLTAPLARITSTAAPPTEPRWSLVVTTAPHHPQDVWFTATGNNTDGWHGGGCLCIGPLAQGLGPGDHATILIDVVEAGVFGIDGTPVAPGTYIAPGVSVVRPRTGPAEELSDREFEMEEGRTFYVIAESYIVESNIPELPPAGTTLSTMFTFDFDPTNLGRSENLAVIWADFGFGFFPFLNEGVLMTNVRLHR
jgi:hypothetical protein